MRFSATFSAQSNRQGSAPNRERRRPRIAAQRPRRWELKVSPLTRILKEPGRTTTRARYSKTSLRRELRRRVRHLQPRTFLPPWGNILSGARSREYWLIDPRNQRRPKPALRLAPLSGAVVNTSPLISSSANTGRRDIDSDELAAPTRNAQCPCRGRLKAGDGKNCRGP